MCLWPTHLLLSTYEMLLHLFNMFWLLYTIHSLSLFYTNSDFRHCHPASLLCCFTFNVVPSSYPDTVEALSTSPSSVQVVWNEVPAIHRNGIIVQYEVEYNQSGSSDSQTESVDADIFVLSLSMLEDFATYLIRVRAYTVVGPGPYSPPVNVTEEEKGLKNTKGCML